MKKMMLGIAAAVSACGFSAFATGDSVESSNIVGYSTVEIPVGYSMFTPVFDKVDGATFTLADITVCNASGVEFDNNAAGAGVVGSGKLKVRKLNTGTVINPSSEWAYMSANYDKRETNPNAWGWRANRTKTLESGEGIIVYNGLETPIKFLVAGQVQLKPQMNIPQGYSIWGNNTPVDITLADITVCNASGVEFDNDAAGAGVVGSGKLKVRKLNSGNVINPSSEWAYMSANYDKREANPNAWGWRANRTKTLAAGEALLVYNGLGADIIFKLSSPISK